MFFFFTESGFFVLGPDYDSWISPNKVTIWLQSKVPNEEDKEEHTTDHDGVV